MQFGVYLSTLDFDGDGRMDLAISVPNDGWNGTDSGGIDIVLGANL
jgi:hypothetical protein